MLNPAYPAVRARIDVGALDLRPMFPGVLVRREDRLVTLADPRRAPRHLPATLTSGYLRPAELLALARWAAPALGPVRRLLTLPDESRGSSLDRAGITGSLRHEVLEPFLAGVLGEDDGSTSTAFARLVVRSFVLGTAGVPSRGMGAVAQQLAAGLPHVLLGTPVERLERAPDGSRRVHTAGGPVTARAVVVATDPRTAARLGGVRAPAMKGLVTFWYATDEPPTTVPATVVDGRRRGPVVNAAVMSAVAPEYAPAGSHLVQVTCLLHDEVPDEPVVRRQAGEMFGVDAGRWREVTRSVVPDALPAQPAPLHVRRAVTGGGGVFVCGDHRDTASQQGALVSGRRTASAVATWLRR